MNYQILLKINNFIKKRLIELLGLLLVTVSVFLFLSITTYSGGQENFIFKPENFDIDHKNIGGFYGSAISDFLLQSIGLVAFLFAFNLSFWGFKIITKKKINNFITKIFYTLLYLVSGSIFLNIAFPFSHWLSDHGNGGFVGQSIKEFIYYFFPFIENKYIAYVLFFITIVFFILSLSIKLNEILKIILFPFVLIKKIFSFLKKDKEKSNTNDEQIAHIETESFNEKNYKQKQPILPFAKKKETYNQKNIYRLPLIDFLKKSNDLKNKKNIDESDLKKNSEFLEKILLDFGVEGKIKRISSGPVVTLNEFEPASGIKVSKIVNLADDIARHTSSISTRVATIPGKNTIGIEIPNSKRENVFLSEIIANDKFNKREIKLPIALGKDISGTPIIGDLYSMPHLLIAGTTGSGKSVCINTIILSLIYKYTPEKCNLILIDPKMLELSAYEGIPHLLCPVITEAKKATAALGWAVKEMESRYKLMTRVGVKNIDGYNAKNKKHMPYIVVIVDEMSDLMLIAGKEIENCIQRLSQMARAAGIHIIMATQRPSVDVITGTIKANFPTRISFQVSSKIDSRTILGEQGAEQLLGKGDMLFMSSANKIVRIHGPYVSENEIEKVNSFLRSQGEPDYIDEITIVKDSSYESDDNEKDELYFKALEIIKLENKASTSFLQRKLQIGYNRAARIMEVMEKEGIVSQANHVGKREIL